MDIIINKEDMIINKEIDVVIEDIINKVVDDMIIDKEIDDKVFIYYIYKISLKLI